MLGIIIIIIRRRRRRRLVVKNSNFFQNVGLQDNNYYVYLKVKKA